MSDIMSIVRDNLGEREISQLGAAIGADPNSTKQAIGAALPVLLAGLARNANASEAGARSLNTALERDHDGSVLDNLGGLLGAAGALLGGGDGGGGGGAMAGSRALDGAGILEHILGGKRETVERGVGKASGLDTGQIAKLLPLLAPIVMGALGRMKRKEDLGPDELASRLETQTQDAEEKSGLGGIIGGLLDSDDDGSVMDDLARIGSSGVLGSLLRRA